VARVWARAVLSATARCFVTTSSESYVWLRGFVIGDRSVPKKLTTRGITKPAIRRLARRGGVKRISGLIYEGEPSLQLARADPLYRT
jgi:hypothetical protein